MTYTAQKAPRLFPRAPRPPVKQHKLSLLSPDLIDLHRQLKCGCGENCPSKLSYGHSTPSPTHIHTHPHRELHNQLTCHSSTAMYSEIRNELRHMGQQGEQKWRDQVLSHDSVLKKFPRTLMFRGAVLCLQGQHSF